MFLAHQAHCARKKKTVLEKGPQPKLNKGTNQELEKKEELPVVQKLYPMVHIIPWHELSVNLICEISRFFF